MLLYPLNSADAPSITLSEKNYNVTEGKDLQLHCASDGRPPPTVTWKKIAGLSNSAYPQDQRLTIRNATRTDAGVYRCTAVNGIGKQATASMHVDVFCEFVTWSKSFTPVIGIKS